MTTFITYIWGSLRIWDPMTIGTFKAYMLSEAKEKAIHLKFGK